MDLVVYLFLSVIAYFLEPQDSNDLQNAPIIRRSEVESLHFWVPRLRLTRHPLFITIILSAIEKRPYAHTAWQVGTQLRRNAPLFLFISSFSLFFFDWTHKFGKVQTPVDSVAPQGPKFPESGRRRTQQPAPGRSHWWSLCQCGPLRWNYCHSWQDDSLQVIKEVLMRKHLAGLWAPDRIC